MLRPLLLVAWAALAGPAPSPPPSWGKSAERATPEPRAQVLKQRGVALGLFAEDIGFSYEPLLREITELGATHVALIVPLYQTHGGSHDLHLHTRLSPTWEQVADAIRAARRHNLEVTVFPIVRLAAPRKPDEWRGTLAPDRPDLWFARYGEMLGQLAGLASMCGATRLVVGSELSTLDGDLTLWKPLLERVRSLFSGTLVYSANWDHFTKARVFDLVDEEGVVAYFPLRSSRTAPARVADLVRGWQAVREEIAAFRRGRPHPFVFTEVGYRSCRGSSATPWDEVPGGVVDLDEQTRAFAAFRQVWAGDPDLGGLYVWNWYGYGGATSTSYTPRGKPAQIEVRRLLDEL